MNPNQSTPQTPSVNIDSMLNELQSHTPTMDDEAIPSLSTPDTPASIQSEQISQWFSIDVLSTPSVTAQTPAPTPLASDTWSRLPVARIRQMMKTVVPIVATFAIIVVGWWVFATQYPIETKTFFDGVFGVFDTMKTSTSQALEWSEIVSNTSDDIPDMAEVHNAAPLWDDTNTPLTDAMLAAEQANNLPTSQEEIINEVFGNNGDDGMTESTAPISTPQVVDMPSSIIPPVAQVQNQLLTLSQSAEEALAQLVSGSPVKQAMARNIHKNTQDMLQQLLDNPLVLNEDFMDDVKQLQELYEGLVK